MSSLAHGFVDASKSETYGFWYNAAGQVRSSTSSNALYDWNAPANVGRNYATDGQNRYTTAGSLTYGYDGRSNLSSDGVNTYAYDVTNRLTSLSNGATLSYDAASWLFQTTGSSTTRFLYDGDQIVGEYDGSGNLLRRYVPGPAHDEPIVWYEGSGGNDRRWLLADRQASIVAVANGSGTTIGVDTYDDAGIPGSGNIGRFQFDVMAWVPEAGLYHARARAYSLTLGRFMQSNPIGYGDGMNFFNYTHGDPVDGSDPNALDDSVPEVVVTARPELEVPDPQVEQPDPNPDSDPGFGGSPSFGVTDVTVYGRKCKGSCTKLGDPPPPSVQFTGNFSFNKEQACHLAKASNALAKQDAKTSLAYSGAAFGSAVLGLEPAAAVLEGAALLREGAAVFEAGAAGALNFYAGGSLVRLASTGIANGVGQAAASGFGPNGPSIKGPAMTIAAARSTAVVDAAGGEC